VTSSLTYKGPSAASEVETQTMMAFSADRRFARVIDFHSFGEEVVYGYLCSTAHPFTGWWQQVADAIASAAGFVDRTPVAEGEHFQWQLARGALAFLVECHTQFQPTHASALAEAAQVLPGILQLLTLPAALTGHVADACTDAPLDANVTLAGVRFPNGETVSSGGDAGRYDLLMPPLTAQVNFDRPGFRHGNVALAAMPGVEQAADVELLANAIVAGPGTVAVGNPAPFVFTSLSDAGNLYGGLMSVSGISPGIPINDCTLPVKPDPTTFLPFKAPVPFANFVGVLDAAGSTTATFHVPNDPVLAGIDFDFAFFTVDSATLAPRHASNAAHLTTTP
jgi:hypothetical protein